MPKVALRRGVDWDAIEVVLLEGGPGLAAEVGQVLIANGGRSAEGKFVVSSLTLRRSAAQLGAVLRRHKAEVEYEAPVRDLLERHVEEVEARKAARRGDRLTEAQVQERLQRSRFRRTPTHEQARDLARLLALPHGANFSVPGAGKTATLLAIYETLRESGDVDRLLVVCPKNAFLSWEDEADLCYETESPVIRRITGGYDGALEALSKDAEVYLITYQFLPNVLQLLGEWARNHRTHVVLDESHRIKAGEAGVMGTAALSLSGIGVRRDILTGTPLPHSPEDLRAQLEFLWPGQRILPGFRIEPEASDKAMDEIQRQVGPLYVRTTKDELSLPPIDFEPIPVQLGPVQRELYELLRSEAARAASGMTSPDRAYFRALGRYVVRLLQAASNPMLLTHGLIVGEGTEFSQQGVRAFELLREFSRFEKPAKITAAVERVEDALASGRHEKVLIWTSFVQNIHLLERLLKEHNPVILFGAIGTGDEEDPDTREGRIRRFHRDADCRVMIANPAACGESISLHRVCHYAVYVDRTFNAAHYIQSVDRIHRLGLPPDQRTKIEILEAEGTIDLRVYRRLGAKIKVMSQILNDPGLSALAYDPEDLVELYPGGLEPEDVREVVDHLSQTNDRGGG